jgi:hypothetical protein
MRESNKISRMFGDSAELTGRSRKRLFLMFEIHLELDVTMRGNGDGDFCIVEWVPRDMKSHKWWG